MAENTMTEAVVISPAVADLLRNAGLLKGDAPPPPPPRPPTAPEPKVGDIVTVEPVIAVAKTVQTIPSDRTQFTLRMLTATYWLDFPPNDASWIPELDRLLTVSFTATATRPIFMSARVEITEIVGGADTTGHYRAKLGSLYVYGHV